MNVGLKGKVDTYQYHVSNPSHVMNMRLKCKVDQYVPTSRFTPVLCDEFKVEIQG